MSSLEPSWDVELEKFLSMDVMEKITWLSRLTFFVSMFARETYDVDSNGVEKPVALRRYNELLHRIATHQLKVTNNDSEGGMSDGQFFEILSIMVDEIGLRKNVLLDRLQS